MYTTQRIGIFCKTQERANKVFDAIVSDLRSKEFGCVAKVRRSNFESECWLKDGTIIKAVSASENRRSMKFDKIYYDEDIDQEIINCVLYPCIIPSMRTLDWLGLDKSAIE